MPQYITYDIEIYFDYDRDNPDEENYNEEN